MKKTLYFFVFFSIFLSDRIKAGKGLIELSTIKNQLKQKLIDNMTEKKTKFIDNKKISPGEKRGELNKKNKEIFKSPSGPCEGNPISFEALLKRNPSPECKIFQERLFPECMPSKRNSAFSPVIVFKDQGILPENRPSAVIPVVFQEKEEPLECPQVLEQSEPQKQSKELEDSGELSQFQSCEFYGDCFKKYSKYIIKYGTEMYQEFLYDPKDVPIEKQLEILLETLGDLSRNMTNDHYSDGEIKKGIENLQLAGYEDMDNFSISNEDNNDIYLQDIGEIMLNTFRFARHICRQSLNEVLQKYFHYQKGK